ncbi:MAG: hypothetical protein ACP5QK_01715 [Myxococcota bacterium]
MKNEILLKFYIFHLIQNETDVELNNYYRNILHSRLWDADDPKPMKIQQNTLYTFFYAINRPENQQLPINELIDAICVMKIFPET